MLANSYAKITGTAFADICREAAEGQTERAVDFGWPAHVPQELVRDGFSLPLHKAGVFSYSLILHELATGRRRWEDDRAKFSLCDCIYRGLSRFIGDSGIPRD